MNWSLGRGYVPTSLGNNSCDAPWPGPLKTRSVCTIPYPRNDTYYYVNVQGLGTWSGSSVYSSIFDMFLFTSDAEFNLLVPAPGQGGAITSSLQVPNQKGGTSVLTMKWQGTGVANDTYSVWQYATVPSNSGFTYATGCGAKYFMNQRTDVIVNNNGDGTFQAVVDQLDPVAITTITVVVDRPNGYTNTYRTIFVNSTTIMFVNLTLLIFCLLFLLF